MARALWKGAISFGLVNVPVDLYSADRGHSLDLTMLDRLRAGERQAKHGSRRRAS